MKKLMLFMLLGCSLSMSAAPEPAKNDGKIVTTFYGSKASSNANNPCKGATTRVCGKIETTNLAVSDSETLVETVIKNHEGTVISTEHKLVDASLDAVMERQAAEFIHLSNAKVQIVNE